MLLFCRQGAAAASNEAELEWERTLSKDIRFIDVKQTEDGYSLIGSHNQSFDLYLAKGDTEGYLYWEKFHEANSEPGRRYLPGAGTTTPDGGYLIGGTVGIGRERNSPFFIEKYDAEGNSVAYIHLTGGTSPGFSDIRLAKDGGILYANNLGAGLIFMTELSPAKLRIKEKRYGRPSLAIHLRVSDIIPTD